MGLPWTGKGCYRYRPEEKKADVLSFGEKGIPEGIIIDMIECKDGVILVYDNGHVFCIDREEVKVKWELTEIMEEMGNRTDTFFLVCGQGRGFVDIRSSRRMGV